jgi:hypothetical protein
MKIPTIEGIIDRRILINYTVDKGVIQKVIPTPFAPMTYNGRAIVGICLIRLIHLRPKGFPAFVGLSSENGAHRIAVKWSQNGIEKEGVYIPRRDSSSRFNHLVGGRFFPGRHHLAKFEVRESGGHYAVSFKSDDDTSLSIDAIKAKKFNPNSIFKDLDKASDFFKTGAVGYSPNKDRFDGLKLETFEWKVSPLQVNSVRSSFFENERIFPKGSVEFDNALLMTGIKHEWQSVEEVESHGV